MDKVKHVPNPKGNPATLTAPRFKPGQSGNIAGNPQSLRQKLNFDFLKAMKEDFEKNGVDAIRLCREQKPDVYVKVVSTFLPKEVHVSSPLDELTNDELATAIAALQSFVASQGTSGGTRKASERETIN